MYIHIEYGNGVGDHVIVLDDKTCFVTVRDVLNQVRNKFDRRSSCLNIVNEYGVILKNDTIVENARTYRVIRHPRQIRYKKPLYN